MRPEACPLEAVVPELKRGDGCSPYSSIQNAGKGNLGVGSTIFAVKPGDGSAREQAASCQKVLGGWANIANELCDQALSLQSDQLGYASIPDSMTGELPFTNGDYLFVPGIRRVIVRASGI